MWYIYTGIYIYLVVVLDQKIFDDLRRRRRRRRRRRKVREHADATGGIDLYASIGVFERVFFCRTIDDRWTPTLLILHWRCLCVSNLATVVGFFANSSPRFLTASHLGVNSRTSLKAARMPLMKAATGACSKREWGGAYSPLASLFVASLGRRRRFR